jgi:hypothetical protein
MVNKAFIFGKTKANCGIRALEKEFKGSQWSLNFHFEQKKRTLMILLRAFLLFSLSERSKILVP